MPDSNTQTHGRFSDRLGSSIVVQYSVDPIVTLHGQIPERDYEDRLGNQVHPLIKTLFQNNDSVSKTTFRQPELFSHGLKSMKVNVNLTSTITT
jgi:hypothetical protein